MNTTVIRKAVENDRTFVCELMDIALQPYYGGDHRAHATRIFNTHIAGGQDNVGHFSFEQKMFIIEDEGELVGMINIVGKKQGTYKISPIIIAPTAQGKKGFGSALLTYAENHARQQGARQMYCTVAEQNVGALQFFLRKGYIRAGKSESHYKEGVTEIMLYKLFWGDEVEATFEHESISVTELTERHKPDVRKLILDRVPLHFGGVDDDWVDALFNGYERRAIRDINLKYKLIFVATNQDGEVVGVIGATPKKGEPIKLMPCVAKSQQAFTALLTDIPQLLKEHGHKLYVHIVPNVYETVIFQRLGWSLDVAMPAAYRDDIVAQQWSYMLGDGLMRTMRVKKAYFDLICSGKKSIEVRVGYSNIKKIQTGEHIKLMTHREEQVVRVSAIRHYQTFEEMLQHEEANQIVPGNNQEQVLQLLKRLYPQNKERLGVVILEFSN